MKIKIYSWILAGAYLLCGVALFPILVKLQMLFSGFGMELPFATKAVLALGPFGWLCTSVAIGTLVILKDMRFRSRLLNPLLTFILVAWAICIAVTLLYPLMAINCCLAEN